LDEWLVPSYDRRTMVCSPAERAAVSDTHIPESDTGL